MKMYHLVEAESLWALSQRGAVNLPQVKELQDKLRAAGHDPGDSDGWYGQKTADAVKAYQQANGLKVDGDAGPQTLAKLGMSAGSTQPTNTQPSTQQPTNNQPADTQAEPVTGNQQQVDRAANQGGEQLAKLIIGGLLGYGLYRAAKKAGESPPPLGSNPTPVVPGTQPPRPVSNPGRITINSTTRDISRAVDAVSQGQFNLTDWTNLRTLDEAYLKLTLTENSQLANGFLQLRGSNNRTAQADYIAYINRYIRRQLRLIPGNIGSVGVTVYYRTKMVGRFDTYFG